jgi:16S rRNA (cytosine1402-N4)-methyltransferase
MAAATVTARFIGLDWDPAALGHARETVREHRARITLIEDNFTNIGLNLDRLGLARVDGVLFDLGASYHQLKTPDRGFSYANDGPLSMRMSPAVPELCDLLGRASRDEIVEVLRRYGDVRGARRLGELIYGHRQRLRSTFELRGLIESCVPARYLTKNLHKVFQAFRIWVNDEIANLRSGLEQAAARLKEAGRLVVISYHSGEDRIVKQVFRNLEAAGSLRRLNKKVLTPRDEEVRRNPASRSAKMRVAERCAT